MTPAPSRPTRSTRPDRVLAAPPFPPPRPPRSTRAAGSRIWRRAWPWLAALAALVVVVVTELGLLQGRIETDLARLRDAAGVPTAPASVPGPTLPAIPVVAPASAGAIAAVRLRVLDPPCAASGPCTVVVGVDRFPGAVAAPVPWTLLVLDRCRGTLVPLGAGVTAVTGGDYGVATVALPPGPALAVLAVTAEPSHAASPAVSIGAGPC